MRKPRSTPLIAAALLMCLSGCTAASSRLAAPDATAAARRSQLAPICPTPTSPGRLVLIAQELDAGIKQTRPPNTLAAEWERLDEAARKCRGM